MKQISILTLVAALLLSWTEVNEIKWVRTLEDGLKNQKVNGKDIVIYFGASWCGPCRKTEKQVFSTTKFLKFSQNFEMVKIYDDYKEGEKVKRDYYLSTKEKFNIDGIPAFVVIKRSGKQFRISGGYYDSEELIKQINSCK